MIGRWINRDLSNLCVTPSMKIREAIVCIDKNQKGIALVVNEDRKLLGTITDGDVRRSILSGLNIESAVGELLAGKPKTTPHHPVSASLGASRAELLQLMNQWDIQQVPLLDENGHIVDLVTKSDFLPVDKIPLQAVIMAGGYGTRLRPLTEDTPKPMLPVGGRPLMEHIIDQLRVSGIRQINVTTHYKSHKIEDYFGDGTKHGVELRYITENQPLGTAGALSILGDMNEPLLIINGDILTQVNFSSMLNFHIEHKAEMTIAVRQYDVQVPYGVVFCEGVNVASIREKPLYNFFVNAGIYLIEPSVQTYIPKGQRFDMTDLIQYMLEGRKSVVSFPVMEYWLDIGQGADYLKAQEDAREGRFNL